MSDLKSDPQKDPTDELSEEEMKILDRLRASSRLAYNPGEVPRPMLKLEKRGMVTSSANFGRKIFALKK